MTFKEKLGKLKNKILGYQTKSNEVISEGKTEDTTREVIKYVSKCREFECRDKSSIVKGITQHFVSVKSILLDAKVDDYIKWNFENMVKGQYTDIGEYWAPIELRNFIEKMAVWYELRYPDYEINRLMPGSGQEEIEVNDVMFNSNRYINNLLDEDSEVRSLDWDEFYNTHAFIKALPGVERYRFKRPRYNSLVYVDPNYTLGSLHGLKEIGRKRAHLHLTSNGFVKEAECFDLFSDFKVTNKQLKGMHVKDVVKLLKEKGVTLPSENELEVAINDVECWIKQKEGMLDAVMYRIIERGGNRIGPRRGFLFAKEFGRNIDIPMMYGIDLSDPGLREFINEYLKVGGSKDLICYENYFSRTKDINIIKTITLDELLKVKKSYTSEETEFHQRMVNVLAGQIEKEKVRTLKLGKNRGIKN